MTVFVTSSRGLLVLIGLSGICLASFLAVADPPPAAAFGKLPQVLSVSLSPDGTKAVILRAIKNTYHVTLTDFSQGKSRMLMAAKPDEFLFIGCSWATDTRIVCAVRNYIDSRDGLLPSRGRIALFMRDARSVRTRLLAVDADGKNVLQLVPPARSRQRKDPEFNAPDQSTVIGWLPDEPNHILMQIAREHRIFPSVYKININNNKMQRIRRYHSPILRWFADRQGELQFALGVRPDMNIGAYAVNEDGLKELDVSHLAGVNPPVPLAMTSNGKLAYVAANHGADTLGIFEVNLANGEVVNTLYRNARFDAGAGLLQHRQTREPVVLQYYGESLNHHWFDEEIKARFDRASTALPGAPSVVAIVSFDDTWNRLILRAEGNGTFPAFYLYDDAAKSLTVLGTSYPDLGTAVDLKSVSYQARDGHRIPAYYAIPATGEGPYPTVILPHGGPYTRDLGEFDYRVQFLVSRGIAVLKPNFRGSAGYGDAHLASGFNQWGLKMQDDVIDGLDWMIEQGIADPKRVCIMGEGFGGYVALVASYKTPERFRCAVSFAGMTDLAEVDSNFYNFRFGALPIASIQEGKSRAENSPLDHVDEIDLPLLVVHGDVDRSVMIEQSRTLAKALQEAGKPHRYIEQLHGDHFLSLESHRIEFLEALDKFLAQHLLADSDP